MNLKSNLILFFSIFFITSSAYGLELSKIQQRFTRIKDFTASFNQVTFQVIANKTINFEGTISFKRDSGVRMDVKAPQKQILILKGQTILIILPDQGTSQVQEIPKEIAAQNILGFFTGLNSIEEQYKVSILDDHLYLTPKEGTGSISVWVNSDNLIERILLKDALGNTSEVKISSYKFNKGLSDQLFKQKSTNSTSTTTKK